jgi:hypothetical protein
MAGSIQQVRAVYPDAYLHQSDDAWWVVQKWRGGPAVGCWCKMPDRAWRSALDRLKEKRPGPGRRKKPA